PCPHIRRRKKLIRLHTQRKVFIDLQNPLQNRPFSCIQCVGTEGTAVPLFVYVQTSGHNRTARIMIM
ncbi:MAG: hypothetical protein ACI4TE_05365, partial [Alphaproteobacteria bacterium]